MTFKKKIFCGIIFENVYIFKDLPLLLQSIH